MSDVAMAHNLIAEIAGHCWRGKGDMIDRVHTAIAKRYPDWTRRRVRSFWHREAALVKFHEMQELAEVARQERDARTELEAARRSHAEFIERTARLAQALAIQDQDFHREAIEAFSRVTGPKDDRAVQPSARGCNEVASIRSGAGRSLGAGDSV